MLSPNEPSKYSQPSRTTVGTQSQNLPRAMRWLRVLRQESVTQRSKACFRMAALSGESRHWRNRWIAFAQARCSRNSISSDTQDRRCCACLSPATRHEEREDAREEVAGKLCPDRQKLRCVRRRRQREAARLGNLITHPSCARQTSWIASDGNHRFAISLEP